MHYSLNCVVIKTEKPYTDILSHIIIIIIAHTLQ